MTLWKRSAQRRQSLRDFKEARTNLREHDHDAVVFPALWETEDDWGTPVGVNLRRSGARDLTIDRGTGTAVLRSTTPVGPDAGNLALRRLGLSHAHLPALTGRPRVLSIDAPALIGCGGAASGSKRNRGSRG